MKAFKTGFIGIGNMANAIIGGIISNRLQNEDELYIYDPDTSKMEGMHPSIHRCASVGDLAQRADIVFLCVKPNVIPTVCKVIGSSDKAFVSIAAGVKTEKLFSWLPAGSRVMRVMPNTPLLVGKGAACIEMPTNLTGDENNYVRSIFSSLGIVTDVQAAQMDAVTGLSGSGPAYVYHFIDSLARAGEEMGIPYDSALQLSVQTFEGACEMLKQTGKLPEELIDNVCSPGGTTLEAMKVFRQEHIDQTIGNAAKASAERSRELSQ